MIVREESFTHQWLRKYWIDQKARLGGRSEYIDGIMCNPRSVIW